MLLAALLFKGEGGFLQLAKSGDSTSVRFLFAFLHVNERN